MPFDQWPPAGKPEDEPGRYPHFVPPEHLAVKRWKDWTAGEADFFLRWLLKAIPSRLDALFAYFGVERARTARRTLLEIGKKVQVALRTPEFSHWPFPNRGAIDDRALTNRGYALGADLGFLVATYLSEKLKGKVEWAIFRKTRRWAAHNHPVLRSQIVDFEFDMIACGLTGCFGILAGSHDYRFWADLVGVWHNLLLFKDAKGRSVARIDRPLCK
jgi:hypothetical protein